VIYVPHSQLTTWPINHVAKILNFKISFNKLATWFMCHIANWRHGQ